MSFWKQSKGNTSEEFLVKDGLPEKGRWEAKTFSELDTVQCNHITDYTIASSKWNILRKTIIDLFFKEFSVSRNRLLIVSKHAAATDLNTLIAAETFNLFNKDLFSSLYRPFGPHTNRRISIGQDIWDALCAEAKSEGISVHDVVRKVLIYHVDAYPRCAHALELLAKKAPKLAPPSKNLDPVLTVDQIKKVMFDLQ